MHTSGDADSAAHGILAAAGNAYAILLAGFTPVQSSGAREHKKVRDAIDRGKLPGPRLLTSLEPLNDETGGPEKLREAVAQHEADRADFINIFASKSIRQSSWPVARRSSMGSSRPTRCCA